MTTLPFVTVDVFTNTLFGGNPLAVFPKAEGLDTKMMFALAREFNLSEVAFVLPPTDPANTARVRIFTSAVEIGFAGHPNVGVGWVLAGEGEDGGLLRLEQAAGLVEVEVSNGPPATRRCRIRAPQPLSRGEAPSRAAVAACASLAPDQIGEPRLASVALATICVEVSPQVLAQAKCDPAAFAAIADARPDLAEICLLYLYSRQDDQIDARMFAPLSGTIEDPATGSAAAAMCALLLDESGDESIYLDVTQGVAMGRPSRMIVEARRTPDGIRAWVGGGCVPVLRGEALL
jgi:trans-2,3-dihydro-3-hydroxyanthranilate isomerase